ncbi:MAG: carbon starvation CstA family protein [Myxococcota bacterium]
MSVVLPTIVCLAAYFAGYRFYARFLSRRIFGLDPARTTPAHALEEGVDYVPTRRSIVFGHHFASITGLAPMLGPAVAVIWGWLPAMLWVVLGAIFVGCVHDFSALVLSLRARGMSIGFVAEGIIGRRAKTLFHLIIFFGISLAMGVFVFAIGNLFAVSMMSKAPGYPGAVTPSVGLMGIALVLGFLPYRKGLPLAPLAAVAFGLGLLLVYVGHLIEEIGDTVRGSVWGRKLAARAASMRQNGGIDWLADMVELRWWGNRFVSSAAAVGVIAVFAFYEVDGKSAALALWTLFGTTNQLLAGLTLLTATIYLKQRGKPIWFTGLPALLMLATSLSAMASSMAQFVAGGELLLLVVGGILLVLALWLLVEAVIILRSPERQDGPEIELSPAPAEASGRRRAEVAAAAQVGGGDPEGRGD